MPSNERKQWSNFNHLVSDRLLLFRTHARLQMADIICPQGGADICPHQGNSRHSEHASKPSSQLLTSNNTISTPARIVDQFVNSIKRMCQTNWSFEQSIPAKPEGIIWTHRQYLKISGCIRRDTNRPEGTQKVN